MLKELVDMDGAPKTARVAELSADEVEHALGLLWSDALANPAEPSRWKLLFFLLERFPQWRERSPWKELSRVMSEEVIGSTQGADPAQIHYSRWRAPRLITELVSLESRERLQAIRQNPERYASWGLCELLTERSLAVVSEQPRRALDLANLALTVAQHLQAIGTLRGAAWSGSVHALSALAWAHVGNAWRVSGCYAFAGSAFESAEEAWSAATKEDLTAGYLPRLLDLEASLRIDEGELEAAVTLLDEVLAFYRGERTPAYSDSHLAGRALISKARLLHSLDAPTEALELLSQAERLIDLERESGLERSLSQNRVVILVACGRFNEARLLLPRLRGLFDDDPKSLDLLRFSWIEARVLLGLGETHEAAVELERVADGFFAAGVNHDAAVASLELAEIWIGAGESQKVQELAFRMFAVFQAQEVPREALLSLSMFRAAAIERKLTLGVVRSFSDYLERSRKDPSLVFELPVA